MKFTLVSTVFNEANRLSQTIADLKAQTVQPAEIIITDAGSTDGTYDMLMKWKEESVISIIVLLKPRCNVAEGRNMAIRAATYDLIVSTDFGCRFAPHWLESLITPFANSSVKAVGGAFSVAEEEVQTVPAKAAYLLFNGYHDDIHDPHFTPTSRSVAYYKNVFETVGGYPEWLTLAADDTIFGRVAKKKGISFFMVDKPYVFWGRHTTATGYAKEAFRYGLGDGESGINFKNAIARAGELTFRSLFVLVLFCLIFLSLTKRINAVPFLLLLPLGVGFRPYLRHWKMWQKFKSEKYNLRIFVYSLYLMELTRFQYLKGYYKGYFQSPPFRKEEAKKLQTLLAS